MDKYEYKLRSEEIKKLVSEKKFKEAMEIYNKLADSNTVVLFENDLPDNYLN